MNPRIKNTCTIIAIGLISLYFLFCVLINSASPTYYLKYRKTVAKFSTKLSESFIYSSSKSIDEPLTNFVKTEKVVIGLVFCRVGKANENRYFNETLTLIKSLLISCKLYKISFIEIHLFLEYLEDEKLFRKEMNENLYFPENELQVKLSLKVHSAIDAVPKLYRRHMIYNLRFRCGYVKFFYPKSLPKVDSLIHLDSDIIVTGNIGRHWQLLSEMNENQVISVSYSRQPSNNKYSFSDTLVYKDTPFVPPKGVSSGLLVMNLTKMRTFGMSEKLTRVYQDYSRIKGLKLHDMKVLNILLYYNAGLYLIFPCELQFIPTECESGFFCESAFQDPDGLHVVHGNVGKFGKNRIFYPFFKYYSMFNMSDTRSNLTNDLMKPIKEAFSITNSTIRNPCYGILDKILFKRFLPVSVSSEK